MNVIGQNILNFITVIYLFLLSAIFFSNSSTAANSGAHKCNDIHFARGSKDPQILKVKAQKTFFKDRKAYLVKGDLAIGGERQEGMVCLAFLNAPNKEATIGWVAETDVELVAPMGLAFGEGFLQRGLNRIETLPQKASDELFAKVQNQKSAAICLIKIWKAAPILTNSTSAPDEIPLYLVEEQQACPISKTSGIYRSISEEYYKEQNKNNYKYIPYSKIIAQIIERELAIFSGYGCVQTGKPEPDNENGADTPTIDLAMSEGRGLAILTPSKLEQFFHDVRQLEKPKSIGAKGYEVTFAYGQLRFGKRVIYDVAKSYYMSDCSCYTDEISRTYNIHSLIGPFLTLDYMHSESGGCGPPYHHGNVWMIDLRSTKEQKKIPALFVIADREDLKAAINNFAKEHMDQDGNLIFNCTTCIIPSKEFSAESFDAFSVVNYNSKEKTVTIRLAMNSKDSMGLAPNTPDWETELTVKASPAGIPYLEAAARGEGLFDNQETRTKIGFWKI